MKYATWYSSLEVQFMNYFLYEDLNLNGDRSSNSLFLPWL